MIRKILLSAIIILAFTGCNNPEGEEGSSNRIFKDVLPDSNGGRLDVLVVAEESVWRDIAGETFRKYFTEALHGLPQAEPLFSVHQVAPKEFNTLLERSRNILRLEIGSENYTIRSDVFAKPQLVMNFRAGDEQALARLIAENHEKAIATFWQSEVNYLQKRVTKNPQPVPEALKKHHATMRIPRSFELEVHQDDLLVFWNKSLQSDQGILVYFEPIDDDDLLLSDRIVPLRDSLTRLYIPGEKEGSYMRVEDFIPPSYTNIEYDNNFAIETRGLWRVEGDFMGGSFINYSIFDERNNQRIMLDAFIYAPELKKRNMLLELEAILRTFEITN